MHFLGTLRLLALVGLNIVVVTSDALPYPADSNATTSQTSLTSSNTTAGPTYFSPVTGVTQSDLDVPGGGPSTTVAGVTSGASAQTKATQTELVPGLTESAVTKATQTELAPSVTVSPQQQSQQDFGGADSSEGVAGASAGPGSGTAESPSGAPAAMQTSAGTTTTGVQSDGDAGATGSGGSGPPDTTAGSGGASVSGTTSASPQQQTANTAAEPVLPGVALGAVGFIAMLL
ncbi:hypothetical protein LTR95_016666 [Oleoguttula sp. CCFEE 5521]